MRQFRDALRLQVDNVENVSGGATLMVFELPLECAGAQYRFLRIGGCLGHPRRRCSGTRARRRWGDWLRVEARNHRFGVERDEASCSKACSYVVRRNRGVECLDKRVKEVFLRDVGDLHPHHLLDLLAVRGLEGAETSHIERLKEVR